ncbi:hypothetical protein [Vibrio hepatarius]|uniref:hypothetical protein n=1 Tax=Vibrio hepatarius TaxID=171383 RepID=UPI00148B9526|nr:hypothetical protein [Vibrio hepatarius]NOI13549.1 hypothetical protein [Vibrio hepatarius]
MQSYQLEKAPKPGEKVLLGNGEVVFLSTVQSVPEPNFNLTGVPIQCVLSQNADYMDIGAGDIDHDVSGTTRVILYVLLAMALMFGLSDMSPEFNRWVVVFLCLLGTIWLTSMLGYYIVRRRKRPTVRCYRKRQIIAFKPTSSAETIEIPWCELVPYIQVGVMRGMAGHKPLKLGVCSLKLAWYDAKTQKLHTFYQAEPFMLIDFSLAEWAFIQRYMFTNSRDSDVDGITSEGSFALDYKLVPCSANFKLKRQRIWQAFRANNNKRLFSFNLRNMSSSYLSMTIYYFGLILGLWRLPYLFCDIYLALAVTPLLPKPPRKDKTSRQVVVTNEN